MRSLRKLFKYSFFLFALATLLFFTTSYIIRKYFEEEVTAIIISELNKALDAKVDVKDINFSILESFPQASLNFRNVVVYSSSKFDQTSLPDSDKVLVSRSISLKFNLIDLYYRNYDIKSIQFDDTHLYMLEDKNAIPNYIIWKESSDTSNISIKISLEQIHTNNVFLTYAKPDVKIQAFIRDAEFAGQYMAGDVTAILNVKGNIQSVQTNSFTYKRRVPLDFSSNMHVSDSVIKVSNAILHSHKLDLAFNARYSLKGKENYELDLHEASTNIDAIEWFLPDSIHYRIKPYAFKGDIKLSGTLVKDAHKTPQLDVDFYSPNLSAIYKNKRFTSIGLLHLKLSDVNQIQSYSLKSEALKVQLNENNWMQNNLQLTSTKKAVYINWSNDFKLTDELLPLFHSDTTLQCKTNISGNSAGSYTLKESFTIDNLSKFSLNADIYNTSFKYQTASISKLNSTLSVVGKDVFVKDLSATLNNSPLMASFSVMNYKDLLTEDEKSLIINSEIAIDSVDYNMIASFVQSNDNSSGTESFFTEYRVASKIHSKTFIFENHLLENLSVESIVDNNQAKVISSKFSSVFGLFETVANYTMNSKSLSFHSKFSEVDISKFLYEFDSFDQDYLTHDNLKGIVNGKALGKLVIGDDGNIIRNKIELSTTFQIENGKLLDFEPMLAMSKYIEEDELASISFSKINSQLQIHNDSLFLPKVSIESSIADFSVSGEQSLDNAFDYRIQILLSKVMSARRKNKKPKESFGEIIDDGYGRTTLPLRIVGTAEDFKVSYDRKAMKQTVAKRWKSETTELKQILRDEFKRNKKDKSKPKTESEPLPSDFEFDWDD